MPNTMTLISTVTVGAGGAASISFSSIPQTFTDLLLLGSLRSANASVDRQNGMYLNGQGFPNSASTNRDLYGSGVSATSSTTGANSFLNIGTIPAANATSNTFGNLAIYFANYSGNTNKSISTESVAENNATGGNQSIVASLWANTAAITSISMDAATYVQNSTVSLYGILKGSGGATVS